MSNSRAKYSVNNLIQFANGTGVFNSSMSRLIRPSVLFFGIGVYKFVCDSSTSRTLVQ